MAIYKIKHAAVPSLSLDKPAVRDANDTMIKKTIAMQNLASGK
jgi:hypothetical protein